MANYPPVSLLSAVPSPTEVAPLRLLEAYQATAAERAALDPAQVFALRVEVVAAVVTTLGCLPKIAPYRKTIASGMPVFDLSYFDKLETYALALMHAQTEYNAVTKPTEPVEPLSRELLAVREVLLADVTALEARKLVDPRRSELRGPVGYKNQASDVLLLVSVVRSRWSAVAGKSAATQTELDHAQLLAERMLTVVGAKEQGPKLAMAEADARNRAYTLFVRAHDEVRRVMSFLRWHEDDLDLIFPTVFGGKAKPEPKAGAATGEDKPGDARPFAADNGNAANGSGVAKPAQPGMADSDPFAT